MPWEGRREREFVEPDEDGEIQAIALLPPTGREWKRFKRVDAF